MKDVINEKDFILLEGIHGAAQKLLAKLNYLTELTAEVLDETLDESGYGHSADFLYEDSVSDFLSRLRIVVKK